MSQNNMYSNYHQRMENTPNILEVDDRLWEYVIVKQGYYKGKYYSMKKKENALSWNTAAFFVPTQWFAYRKMYLEALIMWVVNNGIVFALYSWLRRTYIQMMANFGMTAENFRQMRFMTREQIMEVFNANLDFSAYSEEYVAEVFLGWFRDMRTAAAIALFVWLVVHLFVSMSANAHYLGRVEKLVASEEGLHKENIQVRRQKKGGVNVPMVFVTLIASLIASFVM
ncbi:MAG: DUF2628 domain-containing protein [Lachnospiraceae bacterium]|nr:DUF2628 domain-containing protein [Lachnospiraceae bacterium]